MTTEAQRIAIAEFCGWKFHALTEHLYTEDEKAAAIMCWVRPGNDSWHTECVPDYLNDLNAMHEAEKYLSDRQKIGYYLDLSLWREDTGELTENLYEVVHATAAQRAEALLKTIGKWEETK